MAQTPTQSKSSTGTYSGHLILQQKLVHTTLKCNSAASCHTLVGVCIMVHIMYARMYTCKILSFIFKCCIVSLDYPLWCWEVETVTMEISPDAVPTLGFVQTGYAMSYTTSHDVTVLVSSAPCTYNTLWTPRGPIYRNMCTRKEGENVCVSL